MQRPTCFLISSLRRLNRHASDASFQRLKLPLPVITPTSRSAHQQIPLYPSTHNGAKDQGAESHPPRDTDKLLARSAEYGLLTLSDLDRESKLVSTIPIGTRLVDGPPYVFDLRLWGILLEYRAQRYGSSGVRGIWNALRYRGPRLMLTADDEPTTSFWLSLVAEAAKYEDHALLKVLCGSAGMAWKRSNLLAEVVGTCLKYGPEQLALDMLFSLRFRHLAGGDAGALEIYNVFRPTTRAQILQFCRLLAHLPAEQIYGQLVPRVWTDTDSECAFALHYQLIDRGDLPSSFEHIRPFLKHFATRRQSPSQFVSQLSTLGINFASQAQEFYDECVLRLLRDPQTEPPPEVEDVLIEDNTINTTKSMISDSLAARAFATKSLSFDFVLNSLLLFGTIDLGPQAIREIGLAASDLKTFSVRLARLDKLRIDTGSHAYSRLVRRLCSTGQSTLLHSALKTTMHHEVFEDLALQKQLLLDRLVEGNWVEVNLLLSMLHNGEVIGKDVAARDQILDLLRSDKSKQRLVLALLGTGGLGETVPSTSLLPTAKELRETSESYPTLSPPQRRAGLNRLRYLVGVSQEFEAMGGSVLLHQWIPAFIELRLFEKLDDIINVSLWIAQQRPKGQYSRSRQTEGHTIDRLQQFFNLRYQQQLVKFAFRQDRFAGLCQPSHIRWQNLSKALRLLKHLQTRHNIFIHLRSIRRALAIHFRGYRIWKLHMESTQVRSVLSKRQLMMRSARMALRMVGILNDIWKRPDSVLEKDVTTALNTLKDTAKYSERL